MTSPSLPEPRQKIRAFLRNLCDGVGLALPENWPAVPPSELASLRKALRDRIDGLYQFIDSQASISLTQKRYARFFPETTMQLLRLDWCQAESYHEASEEVVGRLEGRPPAVVAYDQLYCTPDSTQRRIHRILQSVPAEPNSRVLFLGDDDLGSVVLAPGFVGETHVIDLDNRLLEFIQERAPSVTRHKVDLFSDGIPKAMKGAFDAVVLDPPWDEYGCWSFLNKAIVCLKQEPHARIFWSFCPLQMELAGAPVARLWKRLAAHGFTAEAIETSFNLYDLVATETDEYQALMKIYLPEVDSLLLQLMKQAPYAFAHLYRLRRIEHFKLGWRAKLQLWWHTSAS